MPSIYVRTTGNDSTGSGAYDNPYLTINKAITVAAAMDVIDVGPGVFLETITPTLSVPVLIQGMLGQTIWQNATIPAVTNPAMLVLGSGLSSTTGRVVITGVIMTPIVVGFNSIVNVKGIPSENIFLARTIFRYKSNEYGVRRDDTDDRHVVILNCTHVSQDLNVPSGRAVCDKNTPAFRKPTVLINNIFHTLRSVVDDVEGERGVVSNWNCYWNNERDFRFGSFGANDIQADPQFLNPLQLDFSLQRSSPCLDAGLDIENLGIQSTQELVVTPSLPFGDGRVRNPIEPPPELNWGAMGAVLDMGAFEFPISDTKRQVNNFNIHTILSGLTTEFDVINSLVEYLRGGRTLDGAEVVQLQERWGRLMGVIRPVGFSRDDYDSFVNTLLVGFDNAPAHTGTTHYIDALLGQQVERYDYNRNPRWRLGTALKIKVPDPGGHPVRAQVNAGRFQLLSQWFDFTQQTIDLSAGVWLLAACPFDVSLLLGNGKPALLSFAAVSDEIIPPSVNYFFSLKVRLNKGSKTVTRVAATPLFSAFQTGFILQAGGYNYFISKVSSDDSLELSEPWLLDDQILTVSIGLPMYPFGYVTVVDGAITRVRTHSRLGSSAFTDTIASRMHGYQIQVGGAQNATVFSSNEAENQLRFIMGRMKSIHKLGYLMTREDSGKGIPLGLDLEQAALQTTPFTETFLDSTWDAAL